MKSESMEEINSTEMAMFYNVENLFLPDPEPIHHLDPTKSGLWNWNQKRYENKIFKIAHVAELVKEEDPDLLDWFLHNQPTKPEFANLIAKLKSLKAAS